MNDDPMLADVRDRLAAARDSLAETHPSIPAREIIARASRRQTRRWLASAGAACAAIGVTLGLVLPSGGQARPVHVHLAAWSVDTHPNGMVTFNLRQVSQPARLQHVLAEAGVRRESVGGRSAWPGDGTFCCPLRDCQVQPVEDMERPAGRVLRGDWPGQGRLTAGLVVDHQPRQDPLRCTIHAQRHTRRPRSAQRLSGRVGVRPQVCARNLRQIYEVLASHPGPCRRQRGGYHRHRLAARGWSRARRRRASGRVSGCGRRRGSA
jgi:hypothetical protein